MDVVVQEHLKELYQMRQQKETAFRDHLNELDRRKVKTASIYLSPIMPTHTSTFFNGLGATDWLISFFNNQLGLLLVSPIARFIK